MHRIITKIYLYRISSELMLLYPLYNVMFADHGLSTFEISTMLMIWSTAILALEVPSGALADKYSRRNLLGIAQIIRALGYALWIFVPTYSGFLAGLLLWGVGRAFTSGAFEALVYDELKAEGQEQRYAKVLGRGESLATFFSLGSTLAATPVFLWLGYPGVLWASVAATIIASAIAFSLPHKKKRATIDEPHYKDILRQAVREVAKSPRLLKLIIFGVFVGMLFRIFDEYASLIIKTNGIETSFVPVVSALVFLPVIFIGFIAHRLERLRQTAFMGMLVCAGAALALAGAFAGIPGLVLFSCFMALVKLSEILFGSKVQHTIQGETRATIISINSFGVEIAAVAGFFVYGLATKLESTPAALELFGIGTLGIGMCYLLFTRGQLLRAQQNAH